MKTLCECGHALSQHPDRGRCDYDGYTCNCKKYKRVKKAETKEDVKSKQDKIWQ